MPTLPPAFLDGLTDPSSTNGAVSGASAGTQGGAEAGAALAARVEARLAELPTDVSARIGVQMLDGEPVRARAALWALRLGEERGWKAVGVSGTHGYVVEHGHDRAVLLPVAGHQPQRDPHLDTLIDQLEGCFAGRRFFLRLGAPLPERFDAAPVVSAVHMWILALERGEWQGRNAVYEHDGVHLELTLAELARREDGPGLVAVVTPSDDESELASVALQIVDGVLECEEHAPDMPLIVAVGCGEAWHPSRWRLLSTLYGVPDRASSLANGGFGYSVRPDGTTWFSDATLRQLAAVWWLYPAADALLGSGLAHENPWCELLEFAPRFPGLRLAPVNKPPSTRVARIGQAAVELSWVRP